MILYDFLMFSYQLAIRLASLWNPKAKKWVEGRKNNEAFQFKQKTIWIHCASLGEFEQGRPVLEKIKMEYPHYPVVLSFFSPSGFEIRKNYPGADKIIYLPLDTSKNAKQLISQINPAIVLWVKYDYWYHFLTTLKKKNIPLLLVSGIFRKEQLFFKLYGGFWRKMLSSFTEIFVQNQSSADLLKSIGFKENITLSGDTRFDRVIDIAKKKETVLHIQSFINEKQVLVAGSLWKEDIEILVHYINKHPEIKFILAPHEPDKETISAIKKKINRIILYSELNEKIKTHEEMNVLVIDNIGMLSKLYQYASITYIGGGFNKSGIHNTLEAAVYGKPVVFGPNYKKFQEATALISAGAALSIQNNEEFEKVMEDYFSDINKINKSGAAAKEVVYHEKGATAKIVSYVKENLLLTN